MPIEGTGIELRSGTMTPEDYANETGLTGEERKNFIHKAKLLDKCLSIFGWSCMAVLFCLLVIYGQ